jgi:hypothetical protein
MRITQMIETIKLVLSILPLIIDLSRKLEQQFPESGLGKMKLSLIIESIKNTVGDSKEALATVEKVISTVVSVFNTFGIFKK